MCPNGDATVQQEGDASPSQEFSTASFNPNNDDDDYNNGEESSNSKKQVALELRKKLEGKSSKAIWVLRFLVLLVLLMTGTGSAIGVYIYLRQGEYRDFEITFEGNAAKIFETFYADVERDLGAMDLASVQVTQYAMSSGSTFPNVTVPNFAIRGSSSRINSAGLLLMFMPLVTEETRSQWEAYSIENQNHISASHRVEMDLRIRQDIKYGYIDNESEFVVVETGQNTLSETFIPFIWGTGNFSIPYTAGPFFPMWQWSPVLPFDGMLNLNFRDFEWIQGAIDETVESNQASFGELTIFYDPNDPTDNSQSIFNDFLLNGQYRHNIGEYEFDPVTMMTYPVFDSFSLSNRNLTGLVVTAIYWREYFSYLLPTNAKGIFLIVENDLGNAQTFRIDGSDVTYIGPGDLHDSYFDYLGASEHITESVNQQASFQSSSYTAVRLSGGYTNYTLHVYPSNDNLETFLTAGPAISAFILIICFVFTAAAFVMYDCVVQKRQQVVMAKAIESTVVVSSLFPSAVRDRLLDSEMDQNPTKSNNNKNNTRTFQRLLHPTENNNNCNHPQQVQLHQDGGNVKDLVDAADPHSKKTQPLPGKPIADSFPETTVLFADLAGFTKWSSSREPEHVFVLLETLYGAIDRLANRRHVFKVETIGDCYVAVTGLPNPQPDHAVLMAKFSRDCLIKMNQLTEHLMDRLGEDTVNLALRVGLHSGAVTAGVLRGDRSRFQLFGETVAIAARMESGGIKGRVHLSQETADRLVIAGKQSWLELRSGTMAIGKREWKTYWLDLQGMKTSLGNSNTVSVGESSERNGDDIIMKHHEE